MSNTFILIHGAWLGGWCWEKLRKMLEAEGHTVLAPDMPGHGEDKSLIEDQNLETYARTVEALIAPLNESVILVGHSFGGMITSQAACYIPSKIKKLVYVSAFLPRDGQSCVGITKSIQPTFHERILASGHDFILSADGKTSKIAPDSCADFVYHDIPRNVAQVFAEHLGPESNAAQQQAAVLNDQFKNIPKAYVRCALDRVIDVKLQDKMIADTYCGEVYTLKTGHCPFESAPRSLAYILLAME
jgi:pimeloyl-ACP methyl ester carboxylesterase